MQLQRTHIKHKTLLVPALEEKIDEFWILVDTNQLYKEHFDNQSDFKRVPRNCWLLAGADDNYDKLYGDQPRTFSQLYDSFSKYSYKEIILSKEKQKFQLIGAL